MKIDGRKGALASRIVVFWVVGLMLFTSFVSLIDVKRNAEMPNDKGLIDDSVVNGGVDKPVFDKSKPAKLYLKAGVFDPKYEKPSISPMLSAKFDANYGGYYIVQFVGPVEPEWLEKIEKMGATFYDFIPDYAYEMKISPSKLNAVRQLPFVRCVIDYEPAFKISPELMESEPYVEIEVFYFTEVPKIENMKELYLGPNHEGPTWYEGEIKGVIGGRTAEERLLGTMSLDGFANIRDMPIMENRPFHARFEQAKKRVQERMAEREFSVREHVAQELAERYGVIITGETLDSVRAVVPHGMIYLLARNPSVKWIQPYYPKKVAMNNVVQYTGASTAGYYGGQSGYGNVTVAVYDSGCQWSHLEFLDGNGGSGVGTDANPKTPAYNGVIVRYMYDSSGALDAGGGPSTSQAEISHGTCTAAIVAAAYGNYSGDAYPGMATSARLIIQEMYGLVDTSGNVITDASYSTVHTAIADARSYGASVHSNSWGGDANGVYGSWSSTLDQDVRTYNMVVCFATGNEAGKCSEEASAKNVISVGAFDDKNTLSTADDIATTFSNKGTDDGRIKPELMAVGSSNVQCAQWTNDATDNSYTTTMGGTSAATPIVAGAAAIVIDWYKAQNGGLEPSASLVKALLINSAQRIVNIGHIPSINQGWGMVYPKGVTTNTNLYYTDQSDSNNILTAGSVTSRHICVEAAGGPLKITVAWSDKNGAASSSQTLINNIDLQVSGGGNLYIGNNFANSWSVAGSASPDTKNNVECVYIQNAVAGTLYDIYINGTPQADVLSSVPGVNQDFSLVISGVVSGIGKVTFSDKNQYGYYKAGNAIIKVSDSNAPGNNVFVNVSSTKCPTPLQITLTREGSSNVFSGSVSFNSTAIVSYGTTVAVYRNDSLTVHYQDTIPAINNRYDYALYDEVAPIISNVVISSVKYTAVKVALNVNEEAKVTFYYQNRTNSKWYERTTGDYYPPEVYDGVSWVIGGIQNDAEFWLQINATDYAGNNATDKNGGSYFKFRTALQPFKLLLVQDSMQFEGGSTANPKGGDPYAMIYNGYIWPDSGWWFAHNLAMNGYIWDTWNTNATRTDATKWAYPGDGSPSQSVIVGAGDPVPLSTLQQYNIVVWDCGSDGSYFNPSTNRISDANEAITNGGTRPRDGGTAVDDETPIRQYISGGGSFVAIGAHIAFDAGNALQYTYGTSYQSAGEGASPSAWLHNDMNVKFNTDLVLAFALGNPTDPIGKYFEYLYFSELYTSGYLYVNFADDLLIYNNNNPIYDTEYGSEPATTNLVSFDGEDFKIGNGLKAGNNWTAIRNTPNANSRTYFQATSWGWCGLCDPVDLDYDGYDDYSADFGISYKCRLQERILSWLAKPNSVSGNVKNAALMDSNADKSVNPNMAGVAIQVFNVSAGADSSVIVGATTTNSEGNYIVDTLSAGYSYRVKACGAGRYQDEWWNEWHTGDAGSPTSIVAIYQGDVPNINFTLDSGAIWGTVYDENGPVYDPNWGSAVVMAYKNGTEELIDYDWTDIEGRYVITGLGAGVYDLKVHPVPLVDGSIANYLYKNASVDCITITSLQHKYPVNIYLKKATGTISGYVRSLGTNSPVAGVEVWAESDGADGVVQTVTAITNGSGYYQLKDLKAGQTFNLSIYKPGWYQKYYTQNYTVIMDTDIPNVNWIIKRAPKVLLVDDDRNAGTDGIAGHKTTLNSMGFSTTYTDTGNYYLAWDNMGSNPGESASTYGGIPNEANQGTFFHSDYAPWPHCWDIERIFWYTGTDTISTNAENPDSPTGATVSTLTWHTWDDILFVYQLFLGGKMVYEGSKLGTDLNSTGYNGGSAFDTNYGAYLTDEYFYLAIFAQIDFVKFGQGKTSAAAVATNPLTTTPNNVATITFATGVDFLETWNDPTQYAAYKTTGGGPQSNGYVVSSIWGFLGGAYEINTIVFGVNFFSGGATNKVQLMGNILAYYPLDLPCRLENFTVTPTEGAPSQPSGSTTYNYTCVYYSEDNETCRYNPWDENSYGYIILLIDEDPNFYAFMEKVSPSDTSVPAYFRDGNFTNGEVFYNNTARMAQYNPSWEGLKVGHHVFMIEAVEYNGMNWDNTGWVYGPEIGVPALSGGACNRTEGNYTEPFKFDVIYTDSGNLAPAYVRVVISGQYSYNMALNTSAEAIYRDGNYANGEKYTVTVYLPSGAHYYCFMAKNTAGASAEGDTYIHNGPIVYYFKTITFSLGWNFIGLPFITKKNYNVTTGSNDILIDIGPMATKISRWNAATGQWVTYNRGSAFGKFAILNGSGYMVYVTSATTWTIIGLNFTVPLKYSLSLGWNSICVAKFGDTNYDVGTGSQLLLQSIGPNATKISRWNAASGQWVTYNAGSAFGKFAIKNDAGYLVYVNIATTWTPT